MEAFLERYFTQHWRMTREISYFMCVKDKKLIFHLRRTEHWWEISWKKLKYELHIYFNLELWVYNSYSHFKDIEKGKVEPKHRKTSPRLQKML
jgi:hypothetical protein